MTARAAISQTEYKRRVKGAVDALGLDPKSVEVTFAPDGSISLRAVNEARELASSDEWDEVLNED